MARRQKIDTSGWKEEGRVERIDIHVASEVKRRGPAAYEAAYEAAKKMLEEEAQKSEGEKKSIEDVRAALQKDEPQYEEDNPERSDEFNNQVEIRNNVKRHIWETHNRAVDDALAGELPKYQAPSTRYA